MTSYERPTVRPDGGKFIGFDHVQFWCSNAKQAATYYQIRFGFEPYAYKGLETGSRDVCTHVVSQNNVLFAFTSPLKPEDNELTRQIALSGDFVRDVCFAVEDARALHAKAVGRGAVSVSDPVEESDELGTIVRATVRTYGNVVHTFLQRNGYAGTFLPGFRAATATDPFSKLLPSPGLQFVDHVVGNQPDLKMVEACDWYEKVLDFHRFWSIDDSQIHTEYSALRSIVMADFDEVVRMPINEPANGKKKSQIQEYVDYHGGAGVQHIAINTSDIITAISNLKARGMVFLSIPSAYYRNLEVRLAKVGTKVHEDMRTIEALGLLVDFDENGYLLQTFSKPVEDRPTLFIEIIQRRNFSGFGAGNFKALFESIERDQAERGNLENDAKKE